MAVLEQLSDSLGGDISGAVAVSSDGIVLASRMASDVNADRVGAVAATMIGVTKRVSGELKIGVTEEAIIKSDNGLFMVLPAGGQSIFSRFRSTGCTPWSRSGLSSCSRAATTPITPASVSASARSMCGSVCPCAIPWLVEVAPPAAPVPARACRAAASALARPLPVLESVPASGGIGQPAGRGLLNAIMRRIRGL